MSKVLYIKANAKPEGVSRTFKVSDSFVKSYKESHPNDEVIVLDSLVDTNYSWKYKFEKEIKEIIQIIIDKNDI